MRFLLLLALFLCGCVSFTSNRLTFDEVAGSYCRCDPWWPRVLELNKDGSFIYEQRTDHIGFDADCMYEGGWCFDGKWAFVTPDKIILKTNRQPEIIVLRARREESGKVAILEMDLFPDIVEEWDSGETSRALQEND